MARKLAKSGFYWKSALLAYFKTYVYGALFITYGLTASFPTMSSECERDVYTYHPKSPDASNQMELKLFFDGSIPETVVTKVRQLLHAPSEYYELYATENPDLKLRLFEACFPNGIIACSMEDYETFLRPENKREFGVFETLKLYRSKGELSNIKPSHTSIPEEIYFDDGALFYFYRTGGRDFLNKVNKTSDPKITFRDDLSAWKLVPCK